MSEPYTHLKLIDHVVFITGVSSMCRGMALNLGEVIPFSMWLGANCPSAEVKMLHSSDDERVAFNGLGILVTIPDPDEAVAYRLRWT